MEQAAAEEERKREERKLRKGRWTQGLDIREDENFSGSLFHTQEKQVQATQVRGTNEERGSCQASQSHVTKTEPKPPVQEWRERSWIGSREYPADRPQWIQEGRRPPSQAGSRSEETEDSGQRDQETDFTNQRMGHTPQRGPRPKSNKTGNTRSSDSEEDHITKDNRHQKEGKPGAHIQNQRLPHTSQPRRHGPPLEPKVIIRQSPKPGDPQVVKTPIQKAN